MADRRQLIQSAEKLASRGKLQAAVRAYRKILDRDPSDTTSLNRLGDLYVRLDEVDEAVELFRKIAEEYTQDGFFVKAIAIYKKILRLDPTLIDVYETLAGLYHRQGLVSEARGQYEVVADYYRKHDDLAGATRIHRRMAELEPERLTHRLHLAELHRERGQDELAVRQYRQIADRMMAADRIDDAVQVYLSAMDVAAGDQGFLTDALVGLRSRGHVEAARRVLEAALERNPAARRLGELTGLEWRPGKEEAEGGEGEAEARSAAEAEPVPADEPQPVPADEPRLSEVAEEGTPEFELDLESLDPLLSLDEELAGEEEGEEEGDWIDVAEVERSAASVVERPPTEQDEFLAEAEVFLKYGLDGKAAERLEEVLARRPEFPEAMQLLVDVELRRERWAEAARVAERLAALAEREVGVGQWRAVERRLEDLGFRVADGAVAPPAGEGEVEVPVEEAATGEAPVREAPMEEAPVEEPLAEEPETEAEAVEPIGAPPSTEETAVAGEEALLELEELLPAEGETGEVSPAAEVGPVEEASAAEEAEPEESLVLEELETDLEWLAEDVDLGGESEEPAEEEIFEGEEEFFDLAAELERELDEEPPAAPPSSEEPEIHAVEQSLEEIVAGFRKGVESSLSPKDFDTHYNLGIAYREMGLLDEAIGEFQLAAKDPRYLVDCCSMLGLCFLEKGFPELAVKWYERGLESSAITERESLGLQYELGNLYASIGDSEAAFRTFVDIYGVNSNYRDVVAKLEELGRDEDG